MKRWKLWVWGLGIAVSIAVVAFSSRERSLDDRIAALSSADIQTRYDTARWVRDHPRQAEPAIPHLVKLIADDGIVAVKESVAGGPWELARDTVGLQVEQALAAIGMPAVPALIAVLRGGSERERDAALRTLLKIAEAPYNSNPVGVTPEDWERWHKANPAGPSG